ncbi:hypothetical protein [Paracidovorax citrulli]
MIRKALREAGLRMTAAVASAIGMGIAKARMARLLDVATAGKRVVRKGCDAGRAASTAIASSVHSWPRSDAEKHVDGSDVQRR